MANKILRLATNSFSTNCVYQLESLHGPKLERPVVYLHACMVRCAAKTLHGFSQQHETLLQEVLNSLPLAQLRNVNAEPEGWDSEAFCTNLHYAYLGVHSNGTFPFSQAHICSLMREYERGNVKGGLQAKVATLLKAHIPNDFPRILGRRLRDLGMDQAAIQSFISPAMGTFSLELKPLLSSLPPFNPNDIN